MPRTILTDEVIDKKCLEYQPLANPNAFFDDVGGIVRSEGIKPVPLRPPPRPARIQYLSNNAGIPLIEAERGGIQDRELAQPILNNLRIVEQALPIASAPPFDPNMLSGQPPQLEVREELEEKQFEGEGFMLYGEPVNLVPADEEEIVYEEDPMEHMMEARRSAVGGAVEELKRLEKAKRITKHITDHRTPIDEGVDVKRAEAQQELEKIGKFAKEFFEKPRRRPLPEKSFDPSTEARMKTFGGKILKSGAVSRRTPAVSVKQEKEMAKIERGMMEREEAISRKGLRGSFGREL